MFNYLLVVQVAAGLYAWSAELNTAFSSSKACVNFLRERGLASNVIMGSQESHTIPISAYLDKQIYYPESHRFGSYSITTMETATNTGVNAVEMLKELARLHSACHEDIVTILSYPLIGKQDEQLLTLEKGWLFPDGTVTPQSNIRLLPSSRLTFLTNFQCIVDEKYYIYIVQE